MRSLFLNRNFSLLLSGRFLINIIDSIYYICVMWLVYDVTKSSIYTGIVGALILLPEVFGFLYGPIIDRSNKKKLLLISTTIQFLLLSVIAIFDFNDSLNITALCIIIFLVALATEFTYPAESALLPSIVDKKDLIKANSWFSISRQGTDLLFNAITGILISILGTALLFIIDASLLIAVFIIFSCLKISSSSNSKSITKSEDGYTFKVYFAELKEGFRLLSNPLLLKMIVPLIFINFIFSGVLIVFPQLADEMGGGASLYGILIACLSSGMMIGSFISESISSRIQIGKMMYVGYIMSGIFWIIFSVSSSYSIITACIFLILSGIPVGATNIIYSTLFQVIPKENMIARLNTITMSLISIAMPIGSILSGIFSEWFYPQTILYANGVMMVFLGLNWLFSKKLRTLPKISEIEIDD